MDERLRRLERRYQETGQDDDRYALLEARCRSETLWDLPDEDAVWLVGARLERGALDPDRAGFAAHAGSELARRALGKRFRARRLPLNREGRAWARGVERYGRVPLLAAACGLAQVLDGERRGLAGWLETLLRQGGAPVAGASTSGSALWTSASSHRLESLQALRHALCCYQNGGSQVEDRVHESFEALVVHHLANAYGVYPLIDHKEAQEALLWCRRWALGGEPAVAPAPAPAGAIPYAPSWTFSTGDRLEHPTFGEGEVIAVRGRAIVVRFGESEKRLVHAQARRP